MPEEMGFRAIGSVNDDGELVKPEQGEAPESAEPTQEYDETLILMNQEIGKLPERCWHDLQRAYESNTHEGDLRKASEKILTKIEQVISREDSPLSPVAQQAFMQNLKEMLAKWIEKVETDKSQLGGFFSNIEKAEIDLGPLREIVAKENLGDEGMKNLRQGLRKLRHQREQDLSNLNQERKLVETAQAIQELQTHPDIYGGAEALVATAIKQYSEDTGIPEEALIELAKTPNTATHPALLKYSASEKTSQLTGLLKECFKQEEDLLLEEMDVKGFEDIHELIANVDVSKEQKEQWDQMLSLEIPEGSKVKVIYIQGGENLDMSDEADHILAGLEAGKLDVTIKTLNNMNLSKEELLTEIKSEMAEEGYDYVIPFFSTHGGTASLHVDRLAKFGFTEVNAENDTFFSENTVAREAADKKLKSGEYQQDATIFVDLYIEEHGKVDIKPGESVDIAGFKFRCEEGASSRNELIERVTTFLFFISVVAESVDTNDLHDIQSEVAKENDTPIIYMFDCCFAGSALDDKFSNLSTTKAILASTSETLIAKQDVVKNRGAFMHQVFDCMKNGSSLGEAFVRADMLLNYTKGTRVISTNQGGQWQNPKAFLRDADGITHKISRLDMDQSTLAA